jgi:hypothetical protein
MRVTDAVQEMSKLYLQRIIDSFTKDYPRIPDETRAREIILANSEEMTSPERVASALSMESSFADQLLFAFILESLIHQPDSSAGEELISTAVAELETEILGAATNKEALRFEDEHAVQVLRSVLEVALEDDIISADELRLIRRLRERLGLSERAKRLIMAQLDHFPRAGNRVHSLAEIRDALVDLQRRGIVFYCNRLDQGRYLIPEEIAPTVRKVVGIELSPDAYRKLLDRLRSEHLASVLEAHRLPKSGSKEERAQRISDAGIQPSAALDVLSNSDLYDLCKALPGARVSGTKQEKIDRLIDYFATLISKDVSDEASPGERFCNYLAQLAARDREVLLANRIISKDREMEGAFEEGTRYLFGDRLGIELLSMAGSDHPDGCFRFGKRGDLLMWDNKSKESEYTFPESHLKQFKRYIRDSAERVSCFLIIVPAIADGAEQNTMRLKYESGADTDVAIITAEDLVYVADTWTKVGGGKIFNAEVFNMTGVLSRQVLDQRMKLFSR